MAKYVNLDDGKGEYIEREAVKNVLNRYLNAPHVRGGNSIGPGMRLAFKSCIELVDNAPAADVEPVRHGEWIPATSRSSLSYGRYECSECHGIDNDCSDYYGTHSVKEQEWCPWCGAKMDGGAENV